MDPSTASFSSITHFLDIFLGYLSENNFRHRTLTIQFELTTNAFSQLLTFNSDYKSLRGSRRPAALPKRATHDKCAQRQHQRHAIVTTLGRIHHQRQHDITSSRLRAATDTNKCEINTYEKPVTGKQIHWITTHNENCYYALYQAK